jgi:hypothetical protein
MFIFTKFPLDVLEAARFFAGAGTRSGASSPAARQSAASAGFALPPEGLRFFASAAAATAALRASARSRPVAGREAVAAAASAVAAAVFLDLGFLAAAGFVSAALARFRLRTFVVVMAKSSSSLST